MGQQPVKNEKSFIMNKKLENPVIIQNFTIYNVEQLFPNYQWPNINNYDKNIENKENDNLNYTKKVSINENINEKISNKNLEIDNQNEISDTSHLKIIIKNKNYRDIQLLVNSDDIIKDIIEKYKSKLQNDKLIDIEFQKQDGKFISPNLTIKSSGIKEMEIINAVICEIDNNNNIPQKNKEELMAKIKQGIERGLIPIMICNPELGNEAFIVDPKVKFKIVATQYSNKHEGKAFFYLFGGQQISREKTLEELEITKFSKILAQEENDD